MTEEQAITMAAKLYDMRRAAKTLLGEKYATEIAKYQRYLPPNDPLPKFIRLSKELADQYGDRATGSILRLAAAAVDMIEQGRAK